MSQWSRGRTPRWVRSSTVPTQSRDKVPSDGAPEVAQSLERGREREGRGGGERERGEREQGREERE